MVRKVPIIPGMAILLAVMLIGLVGCHTDDSAAKYVEVENGGSYEADFDGDGSDETVSITVGEGSGDTYCFTEFTVNGKDCLASNAQLSGFDILNPPFSSLDDLKWYVTDIDREDGIMEMAITDNGASGDPTTEYFIYKDGVIQIAGSTESLLTATSYQIDGDGQIKAQGRLDILQTWHTQMTWEADYDKEGDYIALMPPSPYYDTSQAQQSRYEQAVEEGTSSALPRLLMDISAYSDMDLESVTVTLKASASPVLFVATDNINWVKIQIADTGEEGWIYITDNVIAHINGADIMVDNIFSHLVWVD